MKAARFHARRDVRVDDVPKPGDIGPDEVLVRNEFCGICGSDLHEYADGPIFISSTRNAFSGASVPQILGHEFSGVIECLGRDVKHLKTGRSSFDPTPYGSIGRILWSEGSAFFGAPRRGDRFDLALGRVCRVRGDESLRHRENAGRSDLSAGRYGRAGGGRRDGCRPKRS